MHNVLHRIENNSHSRRKEKAMDTQLISSMEVFKGVILLLELAYKHFRKKTLERIEEKMGRKY